MCQISSSSRKFLCVDLDEDFFYLIRSYSERSGFQAIAIQRGWESLETARDVHPELIVLEADHWTNSPAWEFIRRMQSDPEMHEIPVIVFSWLDDEEAALEKGADVFVRKPVMLTDFQDALGSAGICIERSKNEA